MNIPSYITVCNIDVQQINMYNNDIKYYYYTDEIAISIGIFPDIDTLTGKIVVFDNKMGYSGETICDVIVDDGDLDHLINDMENTVYQYCLAPDVLRNWFNHQYKFEILK